MVSALPRATSSDERALNTLLEGEATGGKSLALMKLEELDQLLDQLVTNITTISDTISERAVMLGEMTYRAAGLSDLSIYDAMTSRKISGLPVKPPSVYTPLWAIHK